MHGLSATPLRLNDPPAWLEPWLYPGLEFAVIRTATLIAAHDATGDQPNDVSRFVGLLQHTAADGSQWSLYERANMSAWRLVKVLDNPDEIAHSANPTTSNRAVALVVCPPGADGPAEAAGLFIRLPRADWAVIAAPALMRLLHDSDVYIWPDSVELPPWRDRPLVPNSRSRSESLRSASWLIGLAALAAVVIVLRYGHDTASPARKNPVLAPAPISTGLLLPDPSQHAPGGRTEASMAYDQLTGDVILFGGGQLDAAPHGALLPRTTWAWNPAGWRAQATSDAPSERSAPALAANPSDGSLLLFGGIGAPPDTWRWDGVNWHRLNARDHPQEGAFPAAVYDTARRQVLLVTTCCATSPPNRPSLLQTWVWTGQDWKRVFTPHAPALLRAPLITYDDARREVVLLTQGSTGARQDVDQVTPASNLWVFDGHDWRHERATPSPPFDPLLDRLGYDPLTQAVVLFQTGTAATWVWNGRNWAALEDAGGPDSPGGLVTETLSGRLLLFGGPIPSENYREIWSWSGKSWHRDS